MASTLHPPATLLLVGVSFLGGFSRFTSGRYTPQWYAYQLARAPNDAGTTAGWLIPTLDLTLGALLIPRRTRRVAAGVITAFFGMGLCMRVASGENWAPDAALFGLAALVFGTAR